MKKISRLTALLLALLLLCTAGVAENAIPMEDMTSKDYAELLASAQDANAAVGKTAVTNQDKVAVHYSHNHLSQTVDTLAKGTVVTITSYNTGWFEGAFWDSYWYGVSYEKNGEIKTGYVQTKYLDVQEPAPEVGYTPWDGTSETAILTCEVKGAASYRWLRGVFGADGSIIWETVPFSTEQKLELEASVENLKYVYCCVALDASGTAIGEPSSEVALVSTELVKWMANNEVPVTEEMLSRAMKATSLESMVLEGTSLIHVRTGEAFASYDPETNILTDNALNVPFGVVDMENKVILPINPVVEPAEETV